MISRVLNTSLMHIWSNITRLHDITSLMHEQGIMTGLSKWSNGFEIPVSCIYWEFLRDFRISRVQPLVDSKTGYYEGDYMISLV